MKLALSFLPTLLALSLTPAFALAPSELSQVVSKVPPLDGQSAAQWIYDPENVLGKERALVAQKLEAIHTAKLAEVGIVILPTTESVSTKDLATSIFEKWKLGDAKAHNGVLILQALDQKRIEVEVGYGLEPTLPDGWVSERLSDTVVPELKQGRMASAHLALLAAIEKKVATAAEATSTTHSAAQDASPTEKKDTSGGWLLLFVFGLLGTLVFFLIKGQPCPQCKKKGLKLKSRECQVKETRELKGKYLLTYQCTHCSHTFTKEQVVSEIQDEDSKSTKGTGGGKSGGAGAGASY